MKTLWLGLWLVVSISATSASCFADLITVTDAGSQLYASGSSYLGPPQFLNRSSAGNTILSGNGVFSYPPAGFRTDFSYYAENSFSVANTSADLKLMLTLSTNVYNGQQESMNGNENLSSRITFTLHEQAIAELVLGTGLSSMSSDWSSSNDVLASLRNVSTGEEFYSSNMGGPGAPPQLILESGTYTLSTSAIFIRNGQLSSASAGGGAEAFLTLTSTATAVPEPSIAIWSGLTLCGWYGRRRWKQKVAS